MKTRIGVLALIGLVSAACEKNGRSFSLAPDTNVFVQSKDWAPKPIDILWVVDNSGSMQNSQTNLTNSFSSFISGFQTLNYDFRMAVTATDAWRAKYTGNNNYVRIRDGSSTSGHSGVFVMDKFTPNLSNVFLINATQGINGSGDERAFESFKDVLSYSGNSDFRRPGAFLAIIIVSDEDDFSNSTSNSIGHNYNHPNIIPISTYTNYLNNLAGVDNYNVSAITILDQACLNQLFDSEQIIAQRYMALADQTKGIKVSLCSNFGPSMQAISNQILSLASSFQLDREPIPSTISVVVNGVSVPQDGTNGWTYTASNLTVTFHGTAIPPAGASIAINFDPVSAQN